MRSTYKYCLSLFLEFIFRTDDKSISVNGKSFRIYSALRFELFTFFMKTHLDMAVSNADAVSDPVALAETMCQRLTALPTSEVVQDEEDETLGRALASKSTGQLGLFLWNIIY